ARSTVGAFLLNREAGGARTKTGKKDYNRVFGADANFVFFRYLTVGGLMAKSEEPDRDGDNWSTSGGVTWSTDLLATGITWLTVDRNFRDDLGFVPRKDQRRYMPNFAIKPRPNSDLIRQFNFRFHSDYITTQDNELETRINHYTAEVIFHSSDGVAYTPHTRMEVLSEPFEIRDGVKIPPGSYSWWYNGMRFYTDRGRRISLSGMYQRHYGFFGGDLLTLQLRPQARISQNFSVEIDYELNRATFKPGTYMNNAGEFPAEEGRFTDHVVNSRVNYNFNNQWLTSTSIQYNNETSSLGFNFRLNYIYRTGDDFFFIYNEGRRVDGPFDGQLDRTVQAKLTYSFDF
ncbi:MAG: hypothetical protein HYX73_10895, partial [Acidobacteria bacterium]|nr:hypothetical protein [Acidobacteriota bacterium]